MFQILTSPEVQRVLAMFVAVWTAAMVSFILINLYTPQAHIRHRQLVSWSRRWEFTPATLGGFSYTSLAVVSILGLFLELLMIRWISSEIRIFAYFKNFVLIGCFLGFGLGCYLCTRKINLLAVVAPLVTLTFLIKLPWPALREVIASLPLFLGAISDVHVWGVPSLPIEADAIRGTLAAILIIVPLFTLVVLVFVPIGQWVGWVLENANKGIRAYSVNVLASLAGILLYTLLCFFYQPPSIWFAVAGIILAILVWARPVLRWTAVAAFAICSLMTSFGPPKDTMVRWSPYQKLELTPVLEDGKTVRYALFTNDSWYQQIIDLSADFVSSHAKFFQDVPITLNAYNLPYRFSPNPQSVLVLGAGMGNDVAAAIRNGAGRVVAVEIDPLILSLGKQLHFEKPYDSPKVERVLDDARSYIENASERFNLIVFSLLDSHTTASHFSNIRIDNYVYTLEALRAAKRLLAPDGVFIIKFQVDTPWIAGRLQGLLTEVFGTVPLQMQAEESYTTAGRFFITGSEKMISAAMSDKRFADYVKARGNVNIEPAPLTTDDWPYFYQHEPGIPASVIIISAVLAVLSWVTISRMQVRVSSLQWHFFFLGAGFLLVETQIISKMALLFGTTWVVNSIIISGLLVLIVASNITVEYLPNIPMAFAYAGLFASIALSYSIPLQTFFYTSLLLKAGVATIVLCLPVFFAGIIFIRSFAISGFSGDAFGANLMGATLGGLLESISLWTGLRSLLIVAGLLYILSYVTIGNPAKATIQPSSR